MTITQTYSDKIGAGTKYEVQKMAYDAARPYAVVATFRSFNRVVGRYDSVEQAKRRARDLNGPGR